MRKVLAAASIVVCVGGLPAGTAHGLELSPALTQLYASVSITPPSARQMPVCYGFVCRRRTFLDFTDADRKRLTEILSPGRVSAEAERKAVQQAVVWFDRRMGPVIGTTKRIARADFRYFADAQNYDCFDTTRNTTSLLLVLNAWGLLRHHTIGDPRYRGNVLIMQTPHNTAILIDKATRKEWVVDMWTRAYAELPEVMPIEEWMKRE